MTTRQEREAQERRDSERSRSIAQQGRDQRIATQKEQSIRPQAEQLPAEPPLDDEQKRSKLQDVRSTVDDVLQRLHDLRISADEHQIGDKIAAVVANLHMLRESAVAVLKGAGLGGKPGEQPPLEDIAEEPTVEDKPEGQEVEGTPEPAPPAEIVEGKPSTGKPPAPTEPVEPA